MDQRPAVISPNFWIVTVVLVAVAVAGLALWQLDRSGQGGSGLGEAFEYAIDEHARIDPSLVGYEETTVIPTNLDDARGVAVGPGDRIYVAGGRGLRVFAPDGALVSEKTLEGSPSALAVGHVGHAFPGRVYLAVGAAVEVLAPESHERLDAWPLPGPAPQVTSIALAEGDVFVADCANRVVLRYDASGELVGRIGDRDEAHGIRGFVIPSPFFDVAVGPDDVLWVVNPGVLRLEGYTFEGRLDLFWGDRASGIEGFFGCCNPAHFTILPDGRFVTAEKGLLRVKVYGANGQFDCVVAGPEQLDTAPRKPEERFDHEYKAVDVAADSQGRVLVLDPRGGNVRVFQPKPTDSETRQ